MTSLTRALCICALTLTACDDPAPDDGRRRSGRYGLVAFNATGFEAFSAYPQYTDEQWYEGFADAVIRHDLHDAGPPGPSQLFVSLQFSGTPFSHIGAGRLWNRPNQLHVRIRKRDDVPLDTRTLFTADMEPPQLRLELQASPTAPSLRYEGEGRLEVFAADLQTGAAWGRFTGELHPLDSDDGPYVISTEFAALPGRVYCVWETPSEMVDGYRGSLEVPEGQVDTCTPAVDAIMAAEAHPDAPPVPDFQPVYFGIRRPPARWDGLDRDL